MSLALLVLAVLILGLMCGSELNLAAFAHPALNRQRLETHTVGSFVTGCATWSCNAVLDDGLGAVEYVTPVAL